MDIRKKQRVVVAALEDIKGRDILVYNTARMPSMFERVVIACGEYAGRMPKGYEVARIDLRDERRLVAALPKSVRLIVLDERGREFTTEQFARLLEVPSAFVIGGAEGLSEATKRAAQIMLRL